MVTDTLEATAYQAIELRRVKPDPDQPRRRFDEAALRELAQSMASNGLLQPIVVRPNGIGYILIAGERRWRAACLLGWETIPAIVRSDVTLGGAAKLQLLENIVRQDLNPVEEARAFKKMLDEGHAIEELGSAVGMTVRQVEWRVEMLSAREDVLHLVANGAIKAFSSSRAKQAVLQQSGPSPACDSDQWPWHQGSGDTMSARIVRGETVRHVS